jgi:RNA-directed DNA polymerase
MVLNNGESISQPALDTSLLEKILSPANMQNAWKQVRRNGGAPGIDGKTIDAFPRYMKAKWEQIKRALLEGYYVPSPVLRVEIPKKKGGKRKLGIPTVLDRVIQQATAQVLSKLFDEGFSEYSYGFRPGRSAHGAIKQVQKYIEQGFRYVVDVDLEKFFDTVNHDLLMHLVGRKVRDKRVLKLIGRYLRAGVKELDGNTYSTSCGTPQGGPLSPLLSNILLDEMDKKLEQKNLRFARYADDLRILVRTREEGELLMRRLTQYLTEELKLRVNRAKSKVVLTSESEFLGFRFVGKKIRWSDDAFHDFKYNVRKLTGRSWGVSMNYRIRRFNEYVRGWMQYFGISEYYRPVQNIDDWVRRRLRMCYWKQWKRVRTKVRKLVELGMPLSVSISAGRSGKSYWRLSKCHATNAAMSNKWIGEQGLQNIRYLWIKAQGYVT